MTILDDDIYFDEKKQIEGLDGVWWIKGDLGSWEGPSVDWAKCHRKAIIQRCIDGGRTGIAVQAGGNLGLYPKLLSKYFRHVFTAEPDRQNFQCLCKNTPESNITKLSIALADVNTMISMNIVDPVNRGASQIDTTTDDGLVPALMLDHLSIPSIDLLWLDIERSEGPAIMGARETISRTKPYVIALESTTSQVDTFLSECGYVMVDTSAYDKVYMQK